MIREAIKNELYRLGWSARKLSEATGVRYPTITEYLNGKRDISGTNLEIILKKLYMENPIDQIEKAIQNAKDYGNGSVGGILDTLHVQYQHKADGFYVYSRIVGSSKGEIKTEEEVREILKDFLKIS